MNYDRTFMRLEVIGEFIYNMGQMLIEYIQAAMERAKYEMIKGEEPYYGEIPDLKGVSATGKTLGECRKKLSEAIEGWLIVRIKKELPIPALGGCRIVEIKEPKDIG
jgi:predicted RNase H-like HicB family nuclease